jgi:DNA polymerase-4
LLSEAVPTIEQRGLTLVGIAVANLDDADALQLVLPFDGCNRDALDSVLDLVRERYGTEAITRAVLLGRSPGITMPMLAD